MKISIAMCTFNGADFLGQQLDSFLAQTRQPDEVVICDDGSTDDTAVVVAAFTGRAPFPVRFVVNDRNLGSTRNFEKAIGLCSGDVIALADQDDVWYPHKLDAISEVFVRDADIGMVFSDAAVVDVDLKELGYRLWQKYNFGLPEQGMLVNGKGFELFVRNQYVTGATMAFRSGLKDLVMPVSSLWVHDGWISLLASAVSKVVAIADPLIMYRQHSRQQIGALRKGIADKVSDSREKGAAYYRKLACQYQGAFDRLEERRAVTNPAQRRSMREKVLHLRTRAEINELGWARIPVVVRELMHRHYHRYSGGWPSMAKDLFGVGRHREMPCQ